MKLMKDAHLSISYSVNNLDQIVTFFLHCPISEWHRWMATLHHSTHRIIGVTLGVLNTDN